MIFIENIIYQMKHNTKLRKTSNQKKVDMGMIQHKPMIMYLGIYIFTPQ